MMHPLLQMAAGFSLFALLAVALRGAREEWLSDRMGLIWSAFFGGLILLNINTTWPSLTHRFPGDCMLVLLALSVFSAGLRVSIQLTVYSRQRRRAMQDLALLRFSFEEARSPRSEEVSL